MRLTRRHRDDADDRDQVRGRDAYPDADPGWRDPPGEPAEGHELVETETHKPARWGLPAMLTAAAGVALAVLGVVALVRTGIDSTWYTPVVEVAGFDHTPLLGALEVGVGALLVLAALAGARMLAALVALAAGVAAAVVAIEPETVERELAMDRSWAVLLAVAGIALGLLILVLGQGARHERRVERRPVRTA